MCLVPGGSDCKEFEPSMWETQVRSWGGEDPPVEGNGKPLQDSYLENPMIRGAWWAIQSMGSQRVRHD